MDVLHGCLIFGSPEVFFVSPPTLFKHKEVGHDDSQRVASDVADVACAAFLTLAPLATAVLGVALRLILAAALAMKRKLTTTEWNRLDITKKLS